MRQMTAVILAAGQGTRMKSNKPKVLHEAMHKPLVQYVITAVHHADIEDICIVVGHGADEVKKALGEEGYIYALQEQQLGTGHALMQAMPVLPPSDSIMVLCGDTPLLTDTTLQQLREYFTATEAACTIMTTVLPAGGNYGRIVRDANDEVAAIVEARDASAEELAIGEINSGVYCFDREALTMVIDKLTPNNSQGEYYLTDIISELRAIGKKVNAYVCQDADEIMGVNDRYQLFQASEILRKRKNMALMLSGVTMVDPNTVYIDDTVEISPDCIIEPQVYIEGVCRIGSGCHIGPSVKISNSVLGDNCEVGPFCYLRPGTVLANGVKAGHFVEIKKSHVGSGSKVPHLSYIGDAEIGEGVNIGCGTITCNYDGKNKYSTTIEDEAFIGCNTNLVAPVTVGHRSTIAAGSTITEDVPEDSLAIARGRQRNIKGWTEAKDPRYKNNDE